MLNQTLGMGQWVAYEQFPGSNVVTDDQLVEFIEQNGCVISDLTRDVPCLTIDVTLMKMGAPCVLHIEDGHSERSVPSISQ